MSASLVDLAISVDEMNMQGDSDKHYVIIREAQGTALVVRTLPCATVQSPSHDWAANQSCVWRFRYRNLMLLFLPGATSLIFQLCFLGIPVLSGARDCHSSIFQFRSRENFRLFVLIA